MTSTKHKLGEFIEQLDGRNTDGKFKVDDVRGISTSKEFITTKADMDGVSLTSYKVVRAGEFAFVPDTSRRGDKMSLAYNNSSSSYIVSSISCVFKVNNQEKLLPDYLYIYFNRPEFDRYARFNSWGSARETFAWEDMCDIEIDLPPIKIQKKYVDIYNAMLKNQESYEKGLTDLKITCDAYIDILKHSRDGISIGNFITQIDNRNKSNNPYAFKGLSMNNYFIDSIANANGLDFSNYKIVAPNEYCAVLMKVGRDKRLTIARNDSNENYLVSPAYYTFKTSKIDSNYFMVTVNRSEFERRGWFSCDTSARGSLPWDEFLNLIIPNADNNEQAIISKLYRVLIERTDINNKLKGCIKDICPILIKGSLEEANK